VIGAAFNSFRWQLDHLRAPLLRTGQREQRLPEVQFVAVFTQGKLACLRTNGECSPRPTVRQRRRRPVVHRRARQHHDRPRTSARTTTTRPSTSTTLPGRQLRPDWRRERREPPAAGLGQVRAGRRRMRRSPGHYQSLENEARQLVRRPSSSPPNRAQSFEPGPGWYCAGY